MNYIVPLDDLCPVHEGGIPCPRVATTVAEIRLAPAGEEDRLGARVRMCFAHAMGATTGRIATERWN